MEIGKEAKQGSEDDAGKLCGELHGRSWSGAMTLEFTITGTNNLMN